MNTINIEVKKKTLQEVYNQVGMLNDMGFPNFQKGEPINNLMREIKRSIKKQKKQEGLLPYLGVNQTMISYLIKNSNVFKLK